MRKVIRMLLKERVSTRKFLNFHIVFPSSQFLDLFFGKKYERHIYNTLRNLTDLNNSNVLDIGANIGQTALSIKSLYPEAKVISYEPGANSFRYLKINSLLNNLDILCVNSAVIGKDLKYNFIEDDITGGRTSFLDQKNPKNNSQLKTILFKDEILKFKPKLIKIDIEGFEWELFKYLESKIFKETFLLIETRETTVLNVFNFFRKTHNVLNIQENIYLKSEFDTTSIKFADLLFIPKV